MSRRQSMFAESAMLRRCAEYWSDHRRVGTTPAELESYLASLSDVADSLFAAAVSAGPMDFRFCCWGKRLRQETGHDLTGCAVGDPALGRFGRIQKSEFTDAILEGAPITSRGFFQDGNGVADLRYVRGVFPVFGPEMRCRLIFGAFEFEGEAPSTRERRVDLDAVVLHDVAQGELLDIELV